MRTLWMMVVMKAMEMILAYSYSMDGLMLHEDSGSGAR
jgi:hypothetical protein